MPSYSCADCGRNDFDSFAELQDHDCEEWTDEDPDGGATPPLVADGGEELHGTTAQKSPDGWTHREWVEYKDRQLRAATTSILGAILGVGSFAHITSGFEVIEVEGANATGFTVEALAPSQFLAGAFGVALATLLVAHALYEWDWAQTVRENRFGTSITEVDS